MEISNPISIVVTTDEHYLVLLAGLIQSIEAHNFSKKNIHFYIIADNISIESRRKLVASIDEKFTTIYWKEVDQVISQGFSLPIDWSSYPSNIHLRLFIPSFLPKEVEKVLYLDVDMIVLRDINELMEVDIDNFIIGAITDSRIQNIGNHWGGIDNYAALGLSPNLPYFNTGLLLINCNAWRKFNATEKIINCINNNKRFAKYPDQYGLNVVLANQWKQLDPLWNYFSDGNHPSPFIVHFVSRKPIYTSYSGNPIYQSLFWEYLSSTKWKQVGKIGEIERYLKKISNVLEKAIKAFF
ncbi:MAG: glycosyltransferase family 8 protein [Sediminibacterium sp.]|nr:glycosyltransferase family 8 protein [Sediminibacterium sp.]